jgi:hypothetical protein
MKERAVALWAENVITKPEMKKNISTPTHPKFVNGMVTRATLGEMA